MVSKRILQKYTLLLPSLLCLLFFIAYTILGFMRYYHFAAGYDISVIDQAIWKYSHFKAPISTNHAYAFTSILTDHVELIFPLISPLYWIWSDIRVLILLQALFICLAGIPLYLLARRKSLSIFTSMSILFSYLAFYGIQNAIWADVHSLVFGMAFLPWYVYLLDDKRYRLSWIPFVLTLLAKEDMALLLFMCGGIYYFFSRNKSILWQLIVCVLYLFGIFFIYFPHFVAGGYRFQNKHGLLANMNMTNIANTSDKRSVWIDTFASFGFLPLLSPLYLLPLLSDLFKYFVLGNDTVHSSQSIFGHYRSSLAFLAIWPTIIVLHRFKKWQTYLGFYLLICAIVLQYSLHSPLSYLAKKWFWTTPSSVASMEQGVKQIPPTAAVVTQINFLPRLSHRDNIFIMWPIERTFTDHSPCGRNICQWFRWSGKPTRMIVNTSTDWDARYWLTNHAEFIDGLTNLERRHIIKKQQTIGTTTIYTVLASPSS